jgi:YidC/Oxa1 family membrane protein insertase
VGAIGQFFGAIFGPIGTIFHFVFFQPVFNILMLVYFGVHNFALAIVILTVIIRLAMIPLYRAQLKSQSEMQKLQPKLAELKEKHRGDNQAMLLAQQQLYKEHGVSPAKGCLPLLIQMPFLYALYYSFFNVLGAHTPAQMLKNINDSLYGFMPHLTLSTLPDTHFFWANLAHADPLHILPVLAAVLTFIQMRMAMPVRKPQARGATPDPTQTSMNTMQFAMPVMTLIFGLQFPAGLAMYWCVSTLFSAVQQYFISGLGSLFLGVPGMERFVPPPKDLTSTSTPSSSTRPAARGQVVSAQPASSPLASAPEGGFRGLWRQLRESVEQAQVNGTANGTTAALTQNGVGPMADTASERPKPRPTGAPSSSAARDRRPRPVREGPTLVRPSAPGAPEAITPEEQIAQAGTSTVNGKPVLPEVAIARDGTSGDSTTPSNGTAAANGKANGASRPNSTSNYRKGPPPGRPRGGRPKGGR